MNTNQLMQERDEVLLSLDEKKIKDFCKKYGISIPESEEAFWAGVHKTICDIYLSDISNSEPVTIVEFSRSFDWLKAHGYGLNT